MVGVTSSDCRQRSAAELANLPATARAAQICPRERSPLLLELLINGELAYSEKLMPRGLHNDGLSSTYFRLPMNSGDFDLEVRLKDHLDQEDFPYSLKRSVALAPAQILIIDFDAVRGEFVLM